MRISVVRLALLMGLAMVVGMGLDMPHEQAGDAVIRQAAEDTWDGGYLTVDMVERLAVESPGTDPDGCRWHVSDDLLIARVTCDDGTYLEWS